MQDAWRGWLWLWCGIIETRGRSFIPIFSFVDPAMAMDVSTLNPVGVLSSALIQLEYQLNGEGVPNASFTMLHALDPDLPAWFIKSFWYFNFILLKI